MQRILLAILPLCFLSPDTTAHAQEWTRFRGPNGTGISDASTIPVEFTEADFNFKTELPGGSGCSSPVVWGDKVFVMSANSEDATRYVVCLNADNGQPNWTKEFKSAPHHLHTRSSYASCTPAVDEERVYIAWSTPKQTIFKAFHHDGSEAWSLDLGTWQSQHGFGTSPIVYKELVIMHFSQQADKLNPGETPGESFMLAFDRKSGKEQWRSKLTSTNVCYSVPFIYSPGDGAADELICCSTGDGIFSLDPNTGVKNWAVNDGLFSMRTVASPIEAGGLIFGSNGSGAYSSNYIVAVQPGKDAQFAYKVANNSKFKAPYVPCLVSDGNLVFCMYDKGFASCIDAKTGKVHWIERTGAALSGSPVRVGDRIYSVDEEGTVWVIAASTEYRLLGKSQLNETCMSTPAIANGRMFLRTSGHLISVGGN